MILNSFFLFSPSRPPLSSEPPLQLTEIQDPKERSTVLRTTIGKIWNSRDFSAIVQTAVNELSVLLDLDGCNFFWYTPESRTVQVVCERWSDDRPSGPLGSYPVERLGAVAAGIERGEAIASSGEAEGEAATPFGAIAYLFVPVESPEGGCGYIGGFEARPREWSAIELEFVQLIAQQLAIAIHQAQLYDRVKKQAQRERLVNQITSQTRQSFDLETILTQAIEQVLEALEIDRCLVHLVEQPNHGDRDRGLDSFKRLNRELFAPDLDPDVAFRRAHLFETCREPFASSIDDFDTHGPISEWVIQHRQPAIVNDVGADSRIGTHNPEYQKAEIKSSLVVPVQANGILHAILYLNQCSRVRYWSKHDRELAQAVADQLAISIQQACLYAQTRASMERESLLRFIGEQIRRTLDLQTILTTVVREVRSCFDSDRVAIYQFQPGRSGKIVVEENSVTPSLSEIVRPDDDFCRYCEQYLQQHPNSSVRAIDNVRHAGFDADQLAYWQHLQVHASMSVPIAIGAELWGVLVVQECQQPRSWLSSEMYLLEQLADRLAIAIKQAQLYEQARLAAVSAQMKAGELEAALNQLRETQSQLIQSEKMSSLGQLVAGVAHEINNPVNFIYGNLSHVDGYTEDLLHLIELYRQHYPDPVAAIADYAEQIDLEFLSEDMPKIVNSMKIGADRIREIVLSLRNFSRTDQAEMKRVDIHEGIDSTLLILQNRLKAKPGHPAIEIVKEYGDLPRVECYTGQLNQVFMNILGNAIDALEGYNKKRSREEMAQHPNRILIQTFPLKADGQPWTPESDRAIPDKVAIAISDNGEGMNHEVRARLFDPFFTTKPVGKGTGLGLSISYQIIVEKHKGSLQCISAPGQGAQFRIEIPVRQLPEATKKKERSLAAVN
ncbi:MAG: GAF domain-containing protein [Cyanobacteria bacterium J007]|nr:MAG: GAF domain-containing protein [Cyanobacteria bacterium J007]